VKDGVSQSEMGGGGGGGGGGGEGGRRELQLEANGQWNKKMSIIIYKCRVLSHTNARTQRGHVHIGHNTNITKHSLIPICM
jgi:hypothetical protein